MSAETPIINHVMVAEIPATRLNALLQTIGSES